MYKTRSLPFFILPYVLPPLNIILFVCIILLTHATIHPTSPPTSYPLRSRGFPTFTIYTTALYTLIGVVSALNILTLYRTLYHRMPRRWLPAFIFLLLLAGGYAPIAATAFTDLFAERAFDNACNGYALMAEIEVLPGFGFQGGNTSVLGASSRVGFWKDGAWVYDMDIIRDYRMPVGFTGSRAKWNGAGGGTVRMQMVVKGEESFLDAGGMLWSNMTERYWNASMAIPVHDNRTNNTNQQTAPGPLASVQLDLGTSRFTTIPTALPPTNATNLVLNGNFSTNRLSFPSLRLQQTRPGSEWRYTNHVCLPPRILLGDSDPDPSMNQQVVDIWGEVGEGCRKYRVCALKYSNQEAAKEGWWEWVESVWPVVAGVVAWEIEGWSACCLRGE